MLKSIQVKYSKKQHSYKYILNELLVYHQELEWAQINATFSAITVTSALEWPRISATSSQEQNIQSQVTTYKLDIIRAKC